jgi:hypothetical protein
VYHISDTESDETMAYNYYGMGQDMGDKGLYKAYTAGLKYFLRDTFLIPFGLNPEDEKHEPVKEVKQVTKKPITRNDDKITEPEAKFLYVIIKETKLPMDKVLALFDAKTTYEVTPAQFRAFMGEVETVIGREAKNITENEYVLIANMIMTKLGGMVE